MNAEEADEQAELLRANDLNALNAKVLDSPVTEVLDVIAEHNTGAMLLRRGFVDLQHEPPSMNKPIDFVGARNGKFYSRARVSVGDVDMRDVTGVDAS